MVVQIYYKKNNFFSKLNVQVSLGILKVWHFIRKQIRKHMIEESDVI